VKDLDAWAVNVFGQVNTDIHPEALEFLMFQYQQVSSVLHRPGFFVLISPSSSFPLNLRIQELSHLLESPAYIITKCMEKHQWTGIFTHAFEFAVQAFIAAAEFCVNNGYSIPIVVFNLRKILLHKTGGLRLRESFLKLLGENFE
jgi:hypothetical protein